MTILNCITILNRYGLSENVIWWQVFQPSISFFLFVVLNLTVLTPFASLRISPIIQLGAVEDLWFPDPSQPWGRTNCDECKGMCYGHFLKPSEALKSTLTPMASPPSTAIKEAFEKLTVYPPPDHELVCNEVAKRVLLSPDQIRMWFKHLHAVKENQEGCCSCSCYKNKQEKEERESSYYCAACRTLFQEFTESVEDWIGCEMCDSWFHFV